MEANALAKVTRDVEQDVGLGAGFGCSNCIRGVSERYSMGNGGCLQGALGLFWGGGYVNMRGGTQVSLQLGGPLILCTRRRAHWRGEWRAHSPSPTLPARRRAPS
eukprot:151100-Chlamydomonas_euryale.AAC.3